ncbi:fructose-1,6-bisphosphatase [Marmoricola endophyticus]|uniref:Fructose-1,6-bisphosphatase n=1 Tax=Marmoricola endophyticus TaxID=2040280 RepID=A0A917F528_9ACTN|nr:inositol monophosphatase family protein [Marmoricola endophyticus]GGF48902.1 fructose-1,6-bisphosphatase [Marmoricola endophyticus]
MAEDPTPPPPDVDDAALATHLVEQAGALAARMRTESDLHVDTKTSVSDVVTAADHACEEYVVSALRRLRPDDGIVGEEGAGHEGTSGRTWYVDPVDGTYNYASGLAYWCSAIALVDTDGVLVGAVHQPSAGETWLGVRGRRTTLNGVPLAALEDRHLDQVSLASYIHPTTVADADVREPWLRIVSAVATPRVLGSGSVDLAGVATGRLGGWAQHSSLPWDWWPGVALVEGAGGTTLVVEHRGHRWHLAGSHQVVAELAQRVAES